MFASSYGAPAAETPPDALDAGGKPSAGDSIDASGPPRVAVRFLLSGASAGSIIGKGGATITEFETQSGARIQLSKQKECFPGTADRILLLTGTINAILTALHLHLSKLADDEPAEAAGGATVKLIIPNAACGAIVGKEGATIRSFIDDSGAAIKLSSKDAAPPGVSDRVVSITGTLEQALRATALVVTRATEEASYPTAIPRPYTYAATAGASSFAAMGMFAAAGRGPALGMLPAVPAPHAHDGRGGGDTTSVVVAVPEEHVGAVIGRSGATINEMQAVSGVSIKVSGRDDVVPHTNHRKVVLTGGREGVQIAQFLLSQKVSQSVLEMEAKRGRGALAGRDS